MTEAVRLYENKKRMLLAPLNTPVENCSRLNASWPKLPELYIKRDDFIGPLVWGNKLRKLEYSLGDAAHKGADTIITFGGIQSNHARITAQVARRAGFDCHLVLHGEKPAHPKANFLVNNLLNVTIHYVSTREERLPKMQEVAQFLERQGKSVYQIPLGASDDIGSYGFVRAMEEVVHYQNATGVQFDYLVHGSSSGGTQAGFLIGKKLFGLHGLKIIGVSADDSESEVRGYIHRALGPMLEELAIDWPTLEAEIDVDTSQIGEGYGKSTALSTKVKEQFAQKEGIILEDIYTSKAAAAIFENAEKGFFKPEDKVLFWHTGGLLTLFK